jgi:uncharacterized small protein (DUF1192 family)
MNKKDLPATKEDLSLLKGSLQGDIARLETKSAAKEDLSLLKSSLQDDIARLEAKSATKEDLSLLKGSLQGDIARLEAKSATKEDLSLLKGSLQGDIARLDAKIDGATKRLGLEIVRTQTDVREIKETMATRGHVEHLMRSFDDFAARAIHYDRADATRGRDLVEFRLKLDEHDRRLGALESAPRPPQAP